METKARIAKVVDGRLVPVDGGDPLQPGDKVVLKNGRPLGVVDVVRRKYGQGMKVLEESITLG